MTRERSLRGTGVILMRCDVCCEMVDERNEPDWLTVERNAMRLNGDPGPWHVCSWACLEALAAHRLGP
jgi:hypothetical protein